MRWMHFLLLLPFAGFAGDSSPKEILALWRALPQLAKDTPQKAYQDLGTWLPNRGLRGLYAKAQFALNIAQLQKLSGHKIFGVGPHQNGKLHLTSANEFGHYNPAFIKWVTANGIPGGKNPKLRMELQPVYDKYLRCTARGFFVAHQNLMDQPARLKRVQARYLDVLDAEKDAGDFLQESFRPDADRLEKAGHDWYEVNVAHGFWVRRTIDGTADEFHILLATLLTTHDSKWMKAQR
ncbi:MAG: hypothetical protein QF685_11355 [Verrucomicrobiota bacterium]|jgi:hypothetical protein|nr:hypothetical protein [Verrucomicrobiota bacterium]